MTRSVYVDLNAANQLKLTTENGYSATNTIYLEREVYDALVAYAQKIGWRP